MICHCDSMLSFERCCGSIIHGQKHAPTALALMRSRYSAHVEKNIQYIWKTYSEEQRNKLSIKQLELGIDAIIWQELEILQVVKGQKEDEYGEVEFLAHYLHKDTPLTLHEHSLFTKENGQWKYIGRADENKR